MSRGTGPVTTGMCADDYVAKSPNPLVAVSSLPKFADVHSSTVKDIDVDMFNQAILTSPEDQTTHLALDILKAEVLNALEHIRAAHGFKAKIESLVAPEYLNRTSETLLINAVELVSSEVILHRDIYSPFQVLATTYDMGCIQTR